MLTCNACEELISEYLDQRLPDSQTSLMLIHCADCRACRSFLTSLVDISTTRARQSPVEVPAEIDRRLRLTLDRGDHPHAHSLIFLVWSRQLPVPVPVAAAIILVVLATGIFSLLESRSSIEPRVVKHQVVTQIMSLPTITVKDE